MGRVSLLLVVVITLGAGCGGADSTASDRPCVVSEVEMASIWDASEVRAHPQDNGYECVYAAENQPIVALAVRSPQEFEAERNRFEDWGVLLPPLEPVSGFDEEANVDPRYNSLNVTAGDFVVSVEILGAEPADPGEQLVIEKRIAQAAISQLKSA
ncbi:MAG TPA: hypothetical protein VE644_05215 [Gaiellaceae bacterium]|nr:hypothetical protein [Gaiellaceae bacterium]